MYRASQGSDTLNHRMAWVGSGLWRSSGSSPQSELCKQFRLSCSSIKCSRVPAAQCEVVPTDPVVAGFKQASQGQGSSFNPSSLFSSKKSSQGKSSSGISQSALGCAESLRSTVATSFRCCILSLHLHVGLGCSQLGGSVSPQVTSPGSRSGWGATSQPHRGDLHVLPAWSTHPGVEPELLVEPRGKGSGGGSSWAPHPWEKQESRARSEEEHLGYCQHLTRIYLIAILNEIVRHKRCLENFDFSRSIGSVCSYRLS